MATGNDTDDIPQDVLDDVNKIRAEAEGESAPAPVEQEVVKLSRRAQAAEDQKAMLAAANERASRAEEIATQTRQEAAQNFARLEGLLQGQMQQRQQPAPRDDEDAPSTRDQINQHMKVAKQKLLDNDLDGYHEEQTKASRLLAQEEFARLNKRQPQVQPQQEKPAWLQHVESKNYDVLMHPDGQRLATAFAAIEGFPQAPTPDKLDRAFAAARAHIAKQAGATPAAPVDNGRARQMMAGGSTGGGSRGARTGERTVNLPRNYKEIAKAAGISPQAYADSYAKMNPGEVKEG